MLVTVNTDAAFHWTHNVGAFSFWMTCNQGRHFGAGPLKGKIQHPHEAEFKALINALYFLIHKTGWSGISKVIFNTDNQEVYKMLKGGETRAWAKPLKKQFNVLAKKGGFITEVRKVKAHSGVDEKRKWVNDWCDKEAKKAIWQLRDEIKTENVKS